MIITTVIGKRFDIPVGGCTSGLRAISFELDSKDLEKISVLDGDELLSFIGRLSADCVDPDKVSK